MMQFIWNLNAGNNLVSFPIIPENISINDVFNSIESDVVGIIGSGIAAFYNGQDWFGGLTEIEKHRGYWLMLNADDPNIIFTFYMEGHMVNSNLEYELIEGFNLISYVGINNTTINEAIKAEYNNQIVAVIGEAKSAFYINGNWVGSLTHFELQKGYWVKSIEDMNFSWNTQIEAKK